MRTLIAFTMLSALALSGCSYLDDTQADKPNSTQKSAIGDLLGQTATIADVIDDPEGASDNDIKDIMNATNAVLAVYPDQRDNIQMAALAIIRDRLYLGPDCRFEKTTEGDKDLLRFFGCDVPLMPDGDCSFAGDLTKTGDIVKGFLTVAPGLGGNASMTCPTETLDFDVDLSNETANGVCGWQVENEDNSFYSYTVFNGIGLGDCGLPASGSLEAGILPARSGTDVRFGGTTLAPFSQEFGFRNSPCGLIITDKKSDNPTDPRQPKTFHAIEIRDVWQDGDDCGTPGADIDAVALYDSGNQLVGYWDVVQGNVPASTSCGPNSSTDTNEAVGAPDGTLTTGYVSLTGGALSGEFAPNSPVINAGDRVEVFEIDSSVGGTDDDYDVFITENGSCASAGGCARYRLGTGTGGTTFNVPSSAF